MKTHLFSNNNPLAFIQRIRSHLACFIKKSVIYISKLHTNQVEITAPKKSLIKIRFKKSQQNRVIIDENFQGHLTLNFSGNNNHVYIGKNVSLDHSSINITQNNSRLIIEDNVTIGRENKISLNDVAASPMIKIGRDCMLSSNVSLRTFDSHPLYDLNDQLLNSGKGDLVLQPHCWIGQDTKILKGVTIGKGSVIGTGSIVTKSLPSHTIAAGIPAKIIKQGEFYWAREHSPLSQQQGKTLSFE